jgi:hypothetical protein
MTRVNGTPGDLMIKVIKVLQGLQPERIYDCSFKQHYEKRSLDANAYYWKLLGEFATYEKVSRVRLHNQMLRNYGQDFEIDGKIVYVTLPDNDKWEDMETFHVRPLSQTFEKGDTTYRTFVLLKGSHEYNTYEMARLIDGLIQEIKGSGAEIETMTPNELERLKGYEVQVNHH